MFPAVDEGDYLIEGEYVARLADQITAAPCQKISSFRAASTCRRTTFVSTPTSLVGSPM
jgi:hypothetical protein